MREALETESAATPPPPVTPRPGGRERPRPASDEGPKLTPSAELEAVLREALEAESAPRPPDTAAAQRPTRRAHVAPARLDVGDTMKEALRQQKLMMDATRRPDATPQRPGSAGLWIVVALLSIGIAATGAWYISGGEPPEATSGATPAARVAAGASTEQAAQALRAVQSSIEPTLSLPAYQAKLAAARTSLDPFLNSGAPPEVRKLVRETLDIYTLAGASWQARSTNSREVWESVGRSPAIELCPGVKQWADAAGPGQARGRAVSTSISALWECADRRIGQLERFAAAR